MATLPNSQSNPPRRNKQSTNLDFNYIDPTARRANGGKQLSRWNRVLLPLGKNDHSLSTSPFGFLTSLRTRQPPRGYVPRDVLVGFSLARRGLPPRTAFSSPRAAWRVLPSSRSDIYKETALSRRPLNRVGQHQPAGSSAHQ